MGTIKTDLYSTHQLDLARYAKALGHPARIAILQHLVATDGCVCGDLVEHVGLAQATVSQHLKALKSVGLIQGEVEGTRVCYCLDATVWQEVRAMLTDFLKMTESGSRCC